MVGTCVGLGWCVGIVVEVGIEVGVGIVVEVVVEVVACIVVEVVAGVGIVVGVVVGIVVEVGIVAGVCIGVVVVVYIEVVGSFLVESCIVAMGCILELEQLGVAGVELGECDLRWLGNHSFQQCKKPCAFDRKDLHRSSFHGGCRRRHFLP